jgi:hypothetical protein
MAAEAEGGGRGTEEGERGTEDGERGRRREGERVSAPGFPAPPPEQKSNAEERADEGGDLVDL